MKNQIKKIIIWAMQGESTGPDLKISAKLDKLSELAESFGEDRDAFSDSISDLERLLEKLDCRLDDAEAEIQDINDKGDKSEEIENLEESIENYNDEIQDQFKHFKKMIDELQMKIKDLEAKNENKN